jgi:hypothetical protein
MKLVGFNAQCPFEIGDKVLVEGENKYATITDICCLHFIKTGRIEFRYEFNESGNYCLLKKKEAEQSE